MIEIEISYKDEKANIKTEILNGSFRWLFNAESNNCVFSCWETESLKSMIKRWFNGVIELKRLKETALESALKTISEATDNQASIRIIKKS